MLIKVPSMTNADKGLRNFINKIAVEQGFKEYNVVIKPLSCKGGNYTAELFLITVSGDKDDLKLFAKVASVGQKLRESAPMKIFDTERYFYTQLLRIYREIEDRHNVTDEYRLCVPKYYGSNPKYLEEILVLEDLASEGYTGYNRLKSMDWPYAARAVEELAKLHALSYAFAREERVNFHEALELLKFSFDEINEEQKAFLDNSSKLAIDAVEDVHKDKITEFVNKMGYNYFKESLVPLKEPVIIHGDFKVDNQMYKISKDGSMALKLMDFQMMQGGSPVTDLLHIILTGTNEEFRKQHYQDLLDHYYEQLCAALRRLDIEPESVYTRDDYDQELRQKLPMCIMITMFALPLITVEEENAPVLAEDADIANLTIEKVGDTYPVRMRGIINDAIRWGVL